jgi:serine/threonine-protein kinase
LKACAACHRLFSDEGGFCPVDGQRLSPISEMGIPTHPEDKRVGRTLCHGRYQIWRVVADGGMGRVYQALDLRANRSVALKILHQEVTLDDVSMERFRREFELSAALPHDHIVEVLAFEQTEDRSFALVMEYLEGEELRTLLKRDKVLSPERMVRMVSQVAMGLASAHERKVVHRDLKPDNIFLVGTRDGDLVKILDFGSVRDNSEGAKKLTVLGTTIGSPFYMAPEQAQGLLSLDHRADVWSLAAIVYECLTGRVPFSGSTGPAILLAILGNEPQPISIAGMDHGVPRTLDPMMGVALAKNADLRIATVAALADRLGQAYGLQGSHRDWAMIPQQVLAARIAEGLPAALARYDAEIVARSEPKPPAAPPAGDPFRAGSGDRLGSASAGAPAFAEDVVMGVPEGLPRWLIPAVAGAAILAGALVAFLIAR